MMDTVLIRLALAASLCLSAVGVAAAQASPDRGGSAVARPPLDSGLVRLPSRVRAETPDAGVRAAAERAGGLRVVVSVTDRELWLMRGRDTVFRAPVAVGTGRLLRHGARAWRFETPRGVRRVLAKQTNPVWVPPDWHYAELAADSGWTLVPLERGRPARLPDGTRVEVRGDRVVHVRPGGASESIPADEEVIFGDTLYMPPLGTVNRRVEGELGAYKLELGSGYMLHGTPHKASIGQAATHGCIRLADDAIAYLYQNVPIGTPVYIY